MLNKHFFFFKLSSLISHFLKKKKLKKVFENWGILSVFLHVTNTCKYFILNQDCVYKCSQWIDNYDETELANWTEFNFESTSVLYKIDKHICYSFQIKS